MKKNRLVFSMKMSFGMNSQTLFVKGLSGYTWSVVKTTVNDEREKESDVEIFLPLLKD